MDIAKDVKATYGGELLTVAQWKKKGYVPMSNVEPHKMLPSKI